MKKKNTPRNMLEIKSNEEKIVLAYIKTTKISEPH